MAAQVERSFVVENYDPISAVSRIRAGELGVRSWLASVRGADERAWYASDDLRPFGLMCARFGWRVATRKLPGNSKHRSPAGSYSDDVRYRPGRAAGHSERHPAPASRQGDSSVFIQGGKDHHD